MKLADILKKIGINIDDDIELNDDDASKLTSGEKSDNLNNDDKKNGDSVDEKDEKGSGTKDKKGDSNKKPVADNPGVGAVESEVHDLKASDLLYDKETGLFDTSKIEDKDVKSILDLANSTVISKANSIKIENAFNEKFNDIKVRKGITRDAVRKLIDLDKVSVEDDKVVGLDEAFETLKAEQSGLFVQRNTSESTPVLEGFNPSDNNSDSDAQMLSFLSSVTSEQSL